MVKIAKVYSYIRFSTMEQADGDSVNRQTRFAREWASRRGVPFDETTTLTDTGQSAFRGTHRDDPDRTALGGFLLAVKEGKIERGSYLVIENLDRLSRESIRPALTLLLNLIEAGIRVVQTQPREMVYDEDADAFTLLIAIMELSRGHGESAMKSVRIAGVWEAAREAAKDGTIMCGRIPAWLRRTDDGDLEPIPDRADAIREMYRLGIAGYSDVQIIKRLDASGHKAFGHGLARDPEKRRASLAGKWESAYVRRLLSDRRLIGYLQPRTSDRKPCGPEIPGYFPAIVTEDDFVKMLAVKANRKKFPGVRQRQNVNTFGGMLRDETGSTIILRTKKGRKTLVSADGNQGRVAEVTFPYEILEGGLLRVLQEIRVSDVDGTHGDTGDIQSLKAARDAAEADVNAVEAELEQGATPRLLGLLRKTEARLIETQEAFDLAVQSQSVPSREAWGTCQTLAVMLSESEDKDDVRVRIRTALRRILTKGTILIVPRGRERLCFVQMRFKEPDITRFALLVYKQGSNGRESAGWVESRADVATGFDLAKSEYAEAMRDELRRIDVQTLIARLSQGGVSLQA